MNQTLLWLLALMAALWYALNKELFGPTTTVAADNAAKAVKQALAPPPVPRSAPALVASSNSYTGEKSWWNDILYFRPSEFDDNSLPPGSGLEMMQRSVIEKLDAARALAGFPFQVSSGYRSPAKNKAVGGVNNSPHMSGLAVDVSFHDLEDAKRAFGCYLEAGVRRIGVYRSLTRPGGYFIHVDTKPGRALWFSNKYPKNGKPLPQDEIDYFTQIFKNYA